MALSVEVNKKVATIKTEAGGTYLVQSFDPTKEGFTPFSSDADAQAWAEAWIVAEEAEQAEKAAAEEAKKAAFEEQLAKHDSEKGTISELDAAPTE